MIFFARKSPLVETTERKMSLRIKIWAIGALSLLTTIASEVSYAGSLQEYELKALYLYNFSTFVHWPDKPDQSDKPFTYCLADEGDVEKALHKLIDDEQINGQPITLTIINDNIALSNCNILYLENMEIGKSLNMVRNLQNQPVMTVSDLQEFTHQGGMVSLSRQGRKLKIFINMDRVRSSGLQFDSKLLHLSIIIGKDND